MALRKGSSVQELREAEYDEIKEMMSNIKEILFYEDHRTIMLSAYIAFYLFFFGQYVIIFLNFE